MPGVPARVAVVDDEPDLRSMIAEFLSREGYEAASCASGAELDERLAAGPLDLVVLDVSMPGEDGLSIARRLHGRVPVIMLTALDTVLDRVVGLEVGADDYITKPFDLGELRARVRAVLRRDTAPPVPAAAFAPDLVSFGRVALDRARRCLVDRAGLASPLIASEFELLDAFAQNPNKVLDRDRLLRLASAEGDNDDRSIDVRISRIRRKVEMSPGKPLVIRTVRGVGYIFVPPRE